MSISYACLVFGLVGAPLGIRKSRTGRSAGIAVSILVILAYYLILGTASRLADSGAVSPATATWVPNGLITVAAVAMVVKKGDEIYFGIGPRISALVRHLASFFRRGGHAPWSFSTATYSWHSSGPRSWSSRGSWSSSFA